MFWFFLIALVVVVGAVTLAVAGGDGDGGALSEAEPDRIGDPLPEDRPLHRTDVESLRLPIGLRGYRMAEADDALDRLAAELTERDARIAELEAALAGAQAAAVGGPELLKGERPGPAEPDRPDEPGAPGAPGAPDQGAAS
ncbi:DivIVA domain-containing protein [Streptomyces sp. NPDC050617]|uniref:DivIVA domain-containing protein n=1 Tax=Streptomyces sp. NPDC050617 TaxID=3154628 RepID=UPI00341AAB98